MTLARWLRGRLDPLIAREIRRLRARYELSLDEFRGLYLSDEQVDRLVAAGREGEPALDDGELGRPAMDAAAADSMWGGLAGAFELSALEQDLLLLATAPECDPRYEVLYAYLNNDVTRKWPTADLASRLLADWADPAAVLAALAPGGVLRSSQLIQPVVAPGAPPALLNSGFVLHPAATLWLHGQAPWLAFGSQLLPWTSVEQLPPIPAMLRVHVAPLVRVLETAHAAGRELPALALVGGAGSGRRSAAAAIAALCGLPLVRLDLAALRDHPEEAQRLSPALGLALTLSPAVVLIDGIAPAEEEHAGCTAGSPFPLAGAIASWPEHAIILLRAMDHESWKTVTGSRRVIEVRCDEGSYEDRVACWRHAARRNAVELPEEQLRTLAGQFRLTGGQVRRTFALARDLAVLAGDEECPTAGRLAQAARLESDQRLGKLATKVDCKHGWEDLVLPALTIRRLRDLAAAIQHRFRVYDEWGFGMRVAAASGIRALFAGGSGTGKTMAAGVIARELGLDLYRVDLSGVVSKYIGETEKNLDRIFTAARTANAVLLLDEAEALVGKRSQVTDSHDRYANIEVAYLLQKLENHDGVVVLATNLKQHMDEAFHRRLQYVIEFPRPDGAERERIWRGMFPRRAPVSQDVDFGFLAKQFDLTGGEICNVVLDAAFLAARDGGVIGMRAIVEALSRQLAKEGKTPTGVEFRQYQGLVRAGH